MTQAAVVARPAHPWRRVLRTVIAGLPAAVVVVPVLVNELNIDPDKYPKVAAISAGVLAVTAVLTRLLAVPTVEAFLQRSVKWLSASDVAIEDVLAVKPEAVQGQKPEVSDGVPVEAVAADASPIPTGTAVSVVPADSSGVI